MNKTCNAQLVLWLILDLSFKDHCCLLWFGYWLY